MEFYHNRPEINKVIEDLDKIDLELNTVKITKNKFFMKLYKDMKTIYSVTKCNKSKIKYKCVARNIKKEEFKDLDFISQNTIDYITTKLHYMTVFNYKNNIIHYATVNKIDNIESIPNIIQHMFTIICLMKKLFKRTRFAQTVFYYECDLPKIFPYEKNSMIKTDNINSAVTMVTSLKNGNIILYRKEEILKVLMHELIHSNLSDYKLIMSSHPKKYIFNNLFCTNYAIQINEAYTESMATMMYIFYKNIINVSCKKINTMFNDLDKMFERELKYSSYICSRIFKHYDLKSIKDIMKTDKKNNKCKSVFLQDSNLFSYYILKNILLRHHIEFGNCLIKNVKDYKIVDAKDSKKDNIISYIIDILIKYINDFDKDVLNPLKKIKIINKSNSIKMCI
jgi:hypothetical protein